MPEYIRYHSEQRRAQEVLQWGPLKLGCVEEARLALSAEWRIPRSARNRPVNAYGGSFPAGLKDDKMKRTHMLGHLVWKAHQATESKFSWEWKEINNIDVFLLKHPKDLKMNP